MTGTRRWAKFQGALPRRVGMAVLVVAVAYVFYGQVATQFEANEAVEQKEEAQQEAKSVADPLDEFCRSDEEIRRRLGDLCDTAAEVKDQPAPPQAGRDGQPGQDGRGIAGTAIAGGRLLITYTDGVVEDKGQVVGQGAPGVPGAVGRGIVSTTIQEGDLVLSYSDGTSEIVGQVVGADGVNGRDGRGISAVTVSADFRLLVTYTDGETVDVGPLPAGRDGRGIASISFDMAACTSTTTYTDGATETKPMTGCEPDEPEPTEPEQPGGLIPGG